MLTGVGHRDIVHFVGVQPYFPLSAVQDGGGKPLLQLEGHHDGLPNVCSLVCDAEQKRAAQGGYSALGGGSAKEATRTCHVGAYTFIFAACLLCCKIGVRLDIPAIGSLDGYVDT